MTGVDASQARQPFPRSQFSYVNGLPAWDLPVISECRLRISI
jgi:hypothetical protein